MKLFRTWAQTNPSEWELRLPLTRLYDYSKEAPLDGVMLVLQDPENYFQSRPRLRDDKKPSCLYELDESDWKAFTLLVSSICQKYWNERLPFFTGLSCFLVLVLCKQALKSFDVILFAPVLLLQHSLVLPLLFSQICLQIYITTANRALDCKIEAACNEFSNSVKNLAIAQLHVEYAGHCSPKFSRPFRGIAISPGPLNDGFAAAIVGSHQFQERDVEREESAEAASERNELVQTDALVCLELPETELKHFAKRDRENIPSGMGLIELKDRMEGDSAAEMVMELYMAMPNGEGRARSMRLPDSHDDGRVVYVPEQDLGELKSVWQTVMSQARRRVERQYRAEGRNRRAPRLVFFHPDGAAAAAEEQQQQQRSSRSSGS